MQQDTVGLIEIERYSMQSTRRYVRTYVVTMDKRRLKWESALV